MSTRSLALVRPMTSHRPVVFVLGQDEILRHRLCTVLKCLPWQVRGLASHSQLPPHVSTACVVAVQEQGLNLMALLDRMRRYDDRARLILLTRDTDIASAVAALRQGVHDLIELPFVERDLVRRVRHAMLTINITTDS